MADDQDHSKPHVSDFDLRQVDRSGRRGNPLFIRILKLSLLLLMAGLAVVTFTWTSFNKDDYVAQVPEKLIDAIEHNELLEARFDSMDKKGQPYTITADKAERGQDDRVFLDMPTGDIQLQNGRFLSAKSRKGDYNENQQLLILTDQVQLFDSEGYVLETEELTVDLDKNIVTSSVPVSGQGPAGLIEAVSLFADADKGLLRFDGPAKLTLFVQDKSKGLDTLR